VAGDFGSAGDLESAGAWESVGVLLSEAEGELVGAGVGVSAASRSTWSLY